MKEYFNTLEEAQTQYPSFLPQNCEKTTNHCGNSYTKLGNAYQSHGIGYAMFDDWKAEIIAA